MDMLTMNAIQFKEIQKKINTVIIPTGMVEAHGPHCALGTDVVIPKEIIKRIEPRYLEKILVAPEVAYGHSWGLSPFLGTIDISAEVFSSYVFEIANGFLKQGFTNIVILNGHGGNNASLEIVTERLANLGANTLIMNWFLDYRDQIKEVCSEPGHAGEDETSLVLAINEEYAYTEGVGSHKIPIERRFKSKDGGRMLYPNAFSGNAEAATKEKGEELFRLIVELFQKDLESLWELDKD